MSRLKTSYEKEIISKLMSKLSLKNKHNVPKIDKIILNMGLGEDASDGKKLKAVIPGGSSMPLLSKNICDKITMDFDSLIKNKSGLFLYLCLL